MKTTDLILNIIFWILFDAAVIITEDFRTGFFVYAVVVVLYTGYAFALRNEYYARGEMLEYVEKNFKQNRSKSKP